MTAEELKTVEDLAGYFFTPDQIIIISGIESKQKKCFDFKQAYIKGKLIKEAAVRKSIVDLAVSGSSPAQVLAVKFIENSKLDEIE